VADVALRRRRHVTGRLRVALAAFPNHRRVVREARPFERGRRPVAGVALRGRRYVPPRFCVAIAASPRYGCIMSEARRPPAARPVTDFTRRRGRDVSPRFPSGFFPIMAALAESGSHLRCMNEVDVLPVIRRMTGGTSPHLERRSLVHGMPAGKTMAGNTIPGEFLIPPADVAGFTGDGFMTAGQGKRGPLVIEWIGKSGLGRVLRRRERGP
jgi:hypothetical protein